MLKNSVGKNIALLALNEIIGAIVMALCISWVMFKLLKMSNNPRIHVLVSLLTVAIINIICNATDFSGVIASVVAGIYFSVQNKKITRWKEVVDSTNMYDDFWSVASTLLGSVLYVMVGLLILTVKMNIRMLLLIPIVIVINFISRFIGVCIGSLLVGKKHIPSRYTIPEFATLLTVSGLKGGISLAMAMTLQKVLPSNEYDIIIATIFVIIIFTTIIQGLLSGRIYEKVEKRREKKYLEKSLRVI